MQTSTIFSNEVDKSKDAAKMQTAGETIFSKIINKTIPAKIIYEDDEVFTLNLQPKFNQFLVIKIYLESPRRGQISVWYITI